MDVSWEDDSPSSINGENEDIMFDLTNPPMNGHIPSLPTLPHSFGPLSEPTQPYKPTEMDIETDGSDDDLEWEEIDIMKEDIEKGLPSQNVEVFIEEVPKDLKKRNGKADAFQRLLRLEAHKMHTVALLASFSLRNKWINDELLHARLLSLTPLPLQVSFTMIHKKTQPDASRRTRLFHAACFKLAEWWNAWFRVIPNRGVRSQTYLEAEQERIFIEEVKKSREKGKYRATTDSTEDSDELPWSDRLRSVKSLMKHALLRSGSADTCALLFTALCRALGIPSRLVVSLQAVPWSSKSEKTSSLELPLPEYPIERPNSATEKSTKGEGHSVKLRRSRPRDRKPCVVIPRSSSTEPPLEGWPPVIWTEVFSRSEGRWIPIDSVRYLVDKKKMFEPPSNCRINRMMYVVAFEEDGYARDVTLRYAHQFGAKTAKARASTKRGHSDWWQRVINILARPYRLHRDDVEDAELQSLQYIEGMPTSIGGFKDHPIYALERHLRRDETIYPMQEIGKFRGEPVYSRSSVQQLRSAETWLREGRVIKVGEQPLKRVVQRAHTINSKRALELAKADSHIDTPMQGLYAKWQTELYVPEPVVEGKIPKNEFGNINLFVPSMLPRGATHLDFQGIAKIARDLEVDFAPAVTGFEFRKGHANPIISGIVIAKENEELVLSAYLESAQIAQEAEAAKRHERVIRRWSRLVEGLRLRKRLLEDYGTTETVIPVEEDTERAESAGGYLNEYDGVIVPFHLPATREIGKRRIYTPIGSDEEENIQPYNPHHSWSPSLETGIGPQAGSTNPNLIQDNPKTLQQRAAEFYATGNRATTSPLDSNGHIYQKQSRKRRKRRLSKASSQSESEPEPISKRLRTFRKEPSPPRRQFRSAARKATQTVQMQLDEEDVEEEE